MYCAVDSVELSQNYMLVLRSVRLLYSHSGEAFTLNIYAENGEESQVPVLKGFLSTKNENSDLVGFSEIPNCIICIS